MKRQLRLLVAACSSFLPAACATTPPQSGHQVASQPIAPNGDNGHIWFYRLGPKGLGIPPAVCLDGKRVAVATPRDAYHGDISPGDHEVNLCGHDEKVIVSVKKGDVVFVRFDVDHSLFGKGIYPVLVNPQTGEEELKRHTGVEVRPGNRQR